MFTAGQLVAHLVGDYLLQPHWMAQAKMRRLNVAVVHGLLYGLPFLLLEPSWTAWTAIVVSHAIIDRWRLARYVTWAKNQLGAHRRPWRECRETGYPPETPDWLAGWLLIVADNTLHVLCNAAALAWL